jgi:hypothetical protein
MPTTFDPSALPFGSVIRLPHTYEDGVERIKIYIVMGHENGHVFCITTTSQGEAYEKNARLMAGVIPYEPQNSAGCFNVKTFVQPDNQIIFSHGELNKTHADGRLSELGNLPANFLDKLKIAVRDSNTLDDRRTSRLRKYVQ